MSMDLNSEMKDFFGESGRCYQVIRISSKTTPPEHVWHVKVRSAQGYLSHEAKAAAIDCGSGIDRATNTHEHWRKLWD